MNYILVSAFCLIFISCKTSPDKTISNTPAEKEKLKDTSYVYCRGKVILPSGKYATVTTPMAGFIKKMYAKRGEFVKKGNPLVRIQNHKFIEIQREYLELKQYFEYYREEFKRQGELTVENAASIKNMQKAKADFWAKNAHYESLKSQLSLLGISASYIEKHGFVHSINIYAPIEGYITSIHGNIGKYINPTDYIYEISDLSSLHVELYLDQNQTQYFQLNDLVEYQFLNNNYQTHTGKIIQITKEIKENKIIVIADIDTLDSNILPKMEIEARRKKRNN